MLHFLYIVLSFAFLLIALFINKRKIITIKYGALALAGMSFCLSLLSIWFNRSIISMAPYVDAFDRSSKIGIFVENVYMRNEWTIAYIVAFICVLVLNIRFFRKPTDMT
jgi:hypothetical protein